MVIELHAGRHPGYLQKLGPANVDEICKTAGPCNTNGSLPAIMHGNIKTLKPSMSRWPATSIPCDHAQACNPAQAISWAPAAG